MNNMIKEDWGRTSDGSEIFRWTVSGDRLSVSFINFGATVQSIVYQGRLDRLNIAASLPDVSLYEKLSKACIGATVGRYAGRIANGRFKIDGREYQLTQNQRGNHLHGGESGFGAKVWEGHEFSDQNGTGVEFTRFSPDGEEGYPGNLTVTVRYTVTRDDCLEIAYRAVSDRDTVINLTNHTYFNPNGMMLGEPQFYGDNRTVELKIDADCVLEIADELPTGRLLPVDGTPFDFRTPKPIARDMPNAPETADGYDHTFVFRHAGTDAPVAAAYGVKSGIRIECFTDQPGAQLYTMGNPGFAFAWEPQHFPDSPNHPDFPGTLLRAGEEFHSRTMYRFSMQ